MVSHFPVVGVIGAGYESRLMVAPAIALGVDITFFAGDHNDPAAQIAQHVVGDFKDLEAIKAFAKKCNVVIITQENFPLSSIRALEADGVSVRPSSATITKITEIALDNESNSPLRISVLVARSPHAQACAWAPTQIFGLAGVTMRTETPGFGISDALASKVQKLALEIAQEISLTGVMCLEVNLHDVEPSIRSIAIGVHDFGLWTIEGSRTSQYEQHLRAVLDLPLGDTAMMYESAVAAIVYPGEKRDMYRPYLHLMARTPGLKIHQYRKSAGQEGAIAHVSATGDDLLDLRECVTHAVDYMSGEIDE